MPEQTNRAEMPEELAHALWRFHFISSTGEVRLFNFSSGKAPQLTEPKLILLAGSHPHYVVYDCGECLIATPKSTYMSRTLAEGMQTADALLREAHRRGWQKVGMGGFIKLARYMWVQMETHKDAWGMQVVGYLRFAKDREVLQRIKTLAGLSEE
jgi:hypothetical protein